MTVFVRDFERWIARRGSELGGEGDMVDRGNRWQPLHIQQHSTLFHASRTDSDASTVDRLQYRTYTQSIFLET